MPVEWKNIPITLNQGVDTKSDPKQVVIGKLLELQNGVFTSQNRITKRHGFDALTRNIEGSSTSTISAAKALTFYNDELNLFTGETLYSYSLSTQNWSNKGGAVSVETGGSSVIRNSYQQTLQDSAYHSTGVVLYTWEDSRGTCRYSVVDKLTGLFLVQDTALEANSVTPKAFTVGNYFVILFINSSTHHLRYVTIPVASPTSASSAADMATNVNTSNSLFDAAIHENKLFIAYNTSTGGGGISVKYIDSLLNVSSATEVTGSAASVCINIAVDTTNSQLWVSHYNGTSVKAFVMAESLSSTLILSTTVVETLANVKNVMGVIGNATATYYYEVSAAATYNYKVRYNTLTRAGSAGTAANFLRSVGLASKPFTYNSVVYFMVTYSSPLQPTYFIVNTSGTIIAKLLPALGGGLTAKQFLTEINAVSDTEFLFSGLIKDLLTARAGDGTSNTTQVYTQTGVQSLSLNFDSINLYQSATMAGNLHYTGGFLSMYDGVSVVEHGFHLFPEPVTVTTSGAGGSIAAGTYSYQVSYEWVDNEGQTHRSAPSIPVSITTTGATSTNTVVIPTLRLTAKQSPRTPVFLVVYRTLANGTTYQRVSSVTSPTLNDLTADTVSFTDTFADSSISANEFIYTTGSVVENIAPPPCSLITTVKNRVILIPSDDRNSFWYSKEVVQGQPVEFSDLFQQKINPKGGGISAVAELDDKIILFKYDRIRVVAGTGPDATGNQNDFTADENVTTDGGCVDPNSVVTMPLGVMYKSSKGIYLLDRSLSTSYIGADVEAYNGETITSATLISTTNQVRFSLTNGKVLVYDYYFKQWSVFTNLHAVDATVFDNTYAYVNSSGITYLENTSYTDNGQFIQLKVSTAWLSLAGLQGYQRAKRLLILGDYKSAHQLLINVAYDFDETPRQEQYIDATTLLANDNYGDDATYGGESVYGGNFPLYQFRLDFTKQKCEAIRVTFEDVQTSDFGEGMSLSNMLVCAGLKRGTYTLPASRSFG